MDLSVGGSIEVIGKEGVASFFVFKAPTTTCQCCPDNKGFATLLRLTRPTSSTSNIDVATALKLNNPNNNNNCNNGMFFYILFKLIFLHIIIVIIIIIVYYYYFYYYYYYYYYCYYYNYLLLLLLLFTAAKY